MPAHRSHGKVYIEPERHDELSEGVPAPAQADAGQERRADGTLMKGARTIPSLGGKAHKGRTRLSHQIYDATGLGPFAKRARFFRKAAATELAATVGNGVCGIIPSALLKLAAQSLALAEAALEAGDIEAHRKLGETARMHMVYARELAAKDAVARPKLNGTAPWLTAEEDGRG